MAFIVRKITEADIEKYELKKRGVRANASNSNAWVIDENNDMYLRCVSFGREETQGNNNMAFYYKGNYVYFTSKVVSLDKSETHMHVTERIFNIEMPRELVVKKQEIFELIEKAWVVSRGGYGSMSMLPADKKYSVSLIFE